MVVIKKMKERQKKDLLAILASRAECPKSLELELRGMKIQVGYRPDYLTEALDMGTRLLAENAEIQNGDWVLTFNCGSGAAGIVAAKLVGERGRVLVADDSVAALGYSRANLTLNQIENAQACSLDELNSQAPNQWNVMLLNILQESKKAGIEKMLRLGGKLLKEGGKFYLAGGKKRGILSLSKLMKNIFGNATPLAYRSGYRVVVSVKKEALSPKFEEEERRKKIQVWSQDYEIVLAPGVFAEGDLDEGTRMLIEVMKIDRDDVVLDLGCGSGIIGMVAANLAPEGKVYLVDSSYLAVKTAKKNLDLNGITGVEVRAGDVLGGLAEVKFDVIVTNPLFTWGEKKLKQLP